MVTGWEFPLNMKNNIENIDNDRTYREMCEHTFE